LEGPEPLRTFAEIPTTEMVLSDFTSGDNLLIAYPERFYNQYEALRHFYDDLINVIPNHINLWVVVNNNSTYQKMKEKYRFKKINILPIKDWDDIWLRDCIGFNATDEVIKPYYYPNYCSNRKYPKYYEKINKQSRIIIKECLQKKIKYMPLILDGGNLVHNEATGFLTDKILEDNNELSKSEIIHILEDFTGLQVQIIPRTKDDTIGHTDAYLSFLSQNKICLSNYPSLTFLKNDVEFLYSLRKNLETEKLEIIELYDRPIDETVQCECSKKSNKGCYSSARGVYMNFLQLKKTVILPEYSLPSGKESKYYNTINKEILENYGYEVLSINCDHLSRLGGSLHCITYTF
jgi:agmatine/peptidylarginine deiminase